MLLFCFCCINILNALVTSQIELDHTSEVGSGYWFRQQRNLQELDRPRGKVHICISLALFNLLAVQAVIEHYLNSDHFRYQNVRYIRWFVIKLLLVLVFFHFLEYVYDARVLMDGSILYFESSVYISGVAKVSYMFAGRE